MLNDFLYFGFDVVNQVFSKLIPDKSIGVHLVETSSTMRAAQQANITNGDRTNVQVHWHTSIAEIPPSSTEYTMLVAHEFFDALPIHILQVIQVFLIFKRNLYSFTQKNDTGAWHEVLVASNIEDNGQTKINSDKTTGPSLSFRRVLAPRPSAVSHVLGHSSLRFQNLPVGSSLEVSPTSFKIARKIGELLMSGKFEEKSAPVGGCGLIIDYGGDHAFGDSFRVGLHKIQLGRNSEQCFF